jgi:WD40 repeat protein
LGERVVDGPRLASASYDSTVKIWDVCTGHVMLTLRGHASGVHAVAFSPDGKLFASAGDDQKVRLWDACTAAEIRTFSGHTKHISGVCFSPDGARVASSSADNTARVWDAITGQELHTLTGHAGHFNCVSFSPDGQLLSGGGGTEQKAELTVWDKQTGQKVCGSACRLFYLGTAGRGSRSQPVRGTAQGRAALRGLRLRHGRLEHHA